MYLGVRGAAADGEAAQVPGAVLAGRDEAQQYDGAVGEGLSGVVDGAGAEVVQGKRQRVGGRQFWEGARDPFLLLLARGSVGAEGRRGEEHQHHRREVQQPGHTRPVRVPVATVIVFLHVTVDVVVLLLLDVVPVLLRRRPLPRVPGGLAYGRASLSSPPPNTAERNGATKLKRRSVRTPLIACAPAVGAVTWATGLPLPVHINER